MCAHVQKEWQVLPLAAFFIGERVIRNTGFAAFTATNVYGLLPPAAPLGVARPHWLD
jgi:hypothetical protein